MAISVGTLAPRVVVVGFVAVACWPTLCKFLATEETKPPEILPELTVATLAPKMPPLPTRDPFGSASELELSKAKDSANAAAKLANSKGSAKSRSADKMGQRAGGSAAAKEANKPVDPLSGLTLDGTCVMGERRLAVINGRLYGLQEQVALDKSATPPYQVVDVFPYKVLLEHSGQILELGYSNVASRPASGHGAKSGGAAGAKGSAKKTKSSGKK